MARSEPVSTCVRVIVTPGSTPPLVSVTVPWMVPVTVWAAAGPLTPSAEALSMRPDGSGGVLVTDGPFTESVEQVVGFYLVETADRSDLVRICGEFAGRGELIEFRDMVGDDGDDRGDDDGGGGGPR